MEGGEGRLPVYENPGTAVEEDWRGIHLGPDKEAEEDRRCHLYSSSSNEHEPKNRKMQKMMKKCLRWANFARSTQGWASIGVHSLSGSNARLPTTKRCLWMLLLTVTPLSLILSAFLIATFQRGTLPRVIRRYRPDRTYSASKHTPLPSNAFGPVSHATRKTCTTCFQFDTFKRSQQSSSSPYRLVVRLLFPTLGRREDLLLLDSALCSAPIAAVDVSKERCGT